MIARPGAADPMSAAANAAQDREDRKDEYADALRQFKKFTGPEFRASFN